MILSKDRHFAIRTPATPTRLLCFGLFCGFLLIGPIPRARADDAAAYLKEGSALYEDHHLAPGRLERAIALYKKALALKPESYFVLWKLSEMYESFGETLGPGDKKKKFALWEKGAEYGKRAVRANPKGKEGHFFYMANMGAIAKHQAVVASIWKFAKIKGEMDRALELDPNYAPAILARGQFLVSVPGLFGGDETEARRLYEKAIEKDPTYVASHYFLAELHYNNKRYNEALSTLAAVINCKKPWHRGNYETIIRPWAVALLKKVRAAQLKK